MNNIVIVRIVCHDVAIPRVDLFPILWQPDYGIHVVPLTCAYKKRVKDSLLHSTSSICAGSKIEFEHAWYMCAYEYQGICGILLYVLIIMLKLGVLYNTKSEY